MGPFSWCSPHLWVEEAGFVYEGDIDVKILFGGGPWVPHTWRDLRKVQVQLEEELDKFGYKDRDLILTGQLEPHRSTGTLLQFFLKKGDKLNEPENTI